MFGLKFSKLPSHRKFSYTPLYYDENKEKLKSQVRDIKIEMGHEEATQESVESNIRQSYESKKSYERYKAPSQRFYGVKIFGLAMIIGLVFYKILNSNLIEIIFGSLNN